MQRRMTGSSFAGPAALRNVRKVWWGNVAIKLSGTTATLHEWTVLMPRFDLIHKSQYLHLFGGKTDILLLWAMTYSIFLPNSHPVSLLRIIPSCWAFSWPEGHPGSALSLSDSPHYGGQGGQYVFICLLLQLGWARDLSLTNQMLALRDFGFCACDKRKERSFRG